KDFKDIFEELRLKGINIYYGRWIRGNDVRLILVDANAFMNQEIEYNGRVDRRINHIKGELWARHGVDSMLMGYDFDEAVGWSTAVGHLIEKIVSKNPDKKIVTHFHEWLSGAGLLYFKRNKIRVATVFTTHATILGRSIAATGADLSRMIHEGLKQGKTIDIHACYQHKVEGKHLMEVACAKESDIFTTVSKTTAKEAEFIYGKKVDMVVPNALDFSKFPTVEKLSVSHAKNRLKIKKFLRTYFAPYYKINLMGCLIFFICGRYEFRNKGIDVYIKALSELNKRLKKIADSNEVYAFIWIPTAIKGPKESVMKNMVTFRRILEIIDDELEQVKFNLIDIVTSREMDNIDIRSILSERFIADCKSIGSQFKREGKPPLCAFDLLYDEDKDTIIRYLKQCGLTNAADDKVRVIFYPAYLTNADQLLGLEYYDALNGSDLGVFPSTYEPWGYTPAETAGLTTLAITTDQAGFGQFLLENTDQSKKPGIRVILRDEKSDEEVIAQLTAIMEEVTLMNKDTLVEKKISAREIAELSDWRKQIVHYINAHNAAIHKVYK
ncbi:MAG TPA: hypothetical protein EYP80_03080, partial [Candidatus Aenigmarchaeota archaeon]|nr:hypothetical protein [Candidatus Aenigmarchaeota archaeon]